MSTQIDKLKAAPLEHLGQRVITLGQMDEAHERPDGTAGRAFRKHRSRLVEGADYFTVEAGRLATRNVGNPGNPSTMQPLLTESGYLLLVKTFRDDLAWQVQRELVAGYFRAQSIPLDPMVAFLVSEVRELRGQMWGFVQATFASQERRIEALETGQERLRAGVRHGLFGRQGGSSSLPRPRRNQQLALASRPAP